MATPRSSIAALIVGVLTVPALAQGTVRVSIATSGAQGNHDSFAPSASADGRFVAFHSYANNLVTGDSNAYRDVFVRDLLTGTTEKMSVSGALGDGNAESYDPRISADGRFVAFQSAATNLVAGDTNGVQDIFVRDRQSGSIVRVSIHSNGTQANGASYHPSISADGGFIAFDSDADNIGGTVGAGFRHVYVHDRMLGSTERIDPGGGGDSDDPSISADGRYVAFETPKSLVGGDTNASQDIYLWDRQALTWERISNNSAGLVGNSDSDNATISPDGRYVVFHSIATNLVAGDTNGMADIFLRDRQAGTTERVSLDAGGAQGNGASDSPTVSADGRYVVFESSASNLVPGDTNGAPDAFLRDRTNATTIRVSVDSTGAQGNGDSFDPWISADGTAVFYESDSSNLVAADTNARYDIFALALGNPNTEPESVGQGGAPSNGGSFDASISADDRFVAFESLGDNLVSGDTNGVSDVFVRDRLAATTIRVSVDTAGVEANGACLNPSITADGRYIAFDSVATNLVPGDTNALADVFVHDLLTSTTTRVSVSTGGTQADGASTNPSFAPGATAVAFESAATNLVAGDTNTALDVFVRDLVGSATTRVSLDSSGAQGDGDSANASMSEDGLLVAFQSAATNLVSGDTNLTQDVFVRNRSQASIVRVSVDSGGTQGLGASTDPSISGDGAFVAFASAAGNLVPGDSNATTDVFVKSRQGPTIKRVSVASDGSQGLQWSGDPSISRDGRHVAFASDSNNLVGGDTNATTDVFVRDVLLDATERVSVDSNGGEGAGASSNPSIAADGRNVAFESVAPNLVVGDTNGFSDAFVRDHGVASAFEEFCPGDGTIAPCPCGNSGTSGRGCQNSGATGGALLTVRGVASLSADTVQFTSSGERPTSLSIFLQGSTPIAPINYGDGIRCTGGTLKRLFTKTAVGGVVTAPQAGDLSVSARSAQLNATIPLGATRPYQVYYRDGAPAFCPDPPGSTFNVSNGFLVAWGG